MTMFEPTREQDYAFCLLAEEWWTVEIQAIPSPPGAAVASGWRLDDSNRFESRIVYEDGTRTDVLQVTA